VLFNSWTYACFLALVVLLFWRFPHRFRLGFVLLASYLFYMAWSPPFGLLYAPVIFLDAAYFYGLSKLMLKWPQYQKAILITGITTELLLLAYFKYAGFLYHSVERLAHLWHIPIPHVELTIFLPLAISFTNFILISYLVDVYRREEPVHFSFWQFVTYVSFFPHLIAGPIVRAKELVHQFEQKLTFKPDYIVGGLHLFLFGLGIKVYVADLFAPYVNLIYGDANLQGFDTSWIATYSFAIQILCDFWGYTLMAQGSAYMMGYTLPDNFHAPYFAVNISDFWRRWHMSLSRWLRDYLYIPLGGSRHGGFNTYRNLFIIMGLGGLWHGASWHFVIWGLYQGALLALHKGMTALKLARFISAPVAWLITFHLVCVGWVFFRATHLQQALDILCTMINPATALGLQGLLYTVSGRTGDQYQSLNSINALTLVILFMTIHWGVRRYKNSWQQLRPALVNWSVGFSYCFLLYLWTSLQTQSAQFIYFQF